MHFSHCLSIARLTGCRPNRRYRLRLALHGAVVFVLHDRPEHGRSQILEIASAAALRTPATDDCQAKFLQLLPQIQRELSYAFRRLDAEARDEAVQDGVVNCYLACVRLVERGRSNEVFPTALARFAVRQIRSGRKCGARLNCQDPLSDYSRQKHCHRVERLDRFDRGTAEWLEPLVEDRSASIPDQVALRIDVPAWLATLTRRLRRIAKDLAIGCSTSDVAQKYRLSAGRISQIRRELYVSWWRFHGDDSAAPAAS